MLKSNFRKYWVLVPLVFLFACNLTKNKVIKYTSLPRVVKGETILVMPFGRLSENDGHDLFNLAKDVLIKTNNVQYLPLVAYDLIAKGISKDHLYNRKMSDSLKMIIAEASKSRYLLFVDILESTEGKSLGYYTNYEVKTNLTNNHQSEMNEAVLDFQLYDTKNYITETRFMIETTVGQLDRVKMGMM